MNNVLRVIAPTIVSCIVPADLSSADRTYLARTVIGAARAYQKIGRPVHSAPAIAEAIVGRRVRAEGPERNDYARRDAAAAAKIDMGGSLESGAEHLARVMGAQLPAQVREAAHEIIGHPIGSHAGDCAICATYHQAKQDAAAWQELLTMTNVSPRIAADLAGAIAAAGYITQTSKRKLREDDF
jgi:hypothetical protein